MSLGPGVRLGPYEVVSAIGAGGMGVVYRARDTRLGRDVAIKVLGGDVAGDPDLRARFRREARAVAALNHPNIVTIHDVADAGDVPYLALELIDGVTLADRLEQGRLPVAEALAIAVQIAEGLAHAHAARIVHRDLKPRNVMIRPDGQVKLLDFGLGKVVADEVTRLSTTGASGATMAGAIVGTVGYMAPEQIRGGAIDERADQFAFGAVLYEMVSGARAFKRETALQTLNAIVESEPAPLAEVAPQVPAGVSRIIDRALEKDPKLRYERSADLVTELRAVAADLSVQPTVAVVARRSAWLRRAGIAAAIAAVAAAGGYISVLPRTGTAPVVRPEGRRMVIAVLPLADATGDPAHAYLGVGVADALTTALSRVSAVSVVTRDRDGEPVDGMNRAQLASALGADLLIEGVVRRLGDRLRVSARLVQPDGVVRWAGDSDGTPAEVVDLENRLATALVEALQVNVTAGERELLARPPTSDPAALALYYQGLTFLDRNSAADLPRAIAPLEEAVARDPAFAMAHAALGIAYRQKYKQTSEPEWIPRATAAATRAVQLDPQHGQARRALATVYRATGRNAAALEELRRMLELDPRSDDAHREIGSILLDEGQFEEAERRFEEAVRLRPQYWLNHRTLGLFYYRTGRLAEAIVAFERVLDLRPDDATAHLQMGTALQASGDLEQAVAHYERSNSLQPTPATFSNLGTLYYARGELDKAIGAYREAITLRPNRPIYRRNLGDALLKQGRAPEARAEYLEALRLAEAELAVGPRDATLMSQLAVYEAKVGRRGDALRHADAATTLNPSAADVLYRRAVVLALNGETAAAVDALEEAVARGYSVTQAAADDDLSSLRSLPAFVQLTARRTQP